MAHDRSTHTPRLSDVWKMMRTPRAKWPAQVPVTAQRPPRPDAEADIVLTFVGHSTFLIQTRTATIITDPVFVERASPVQFAGPRRVRQPGVRLDDLPPISLILLSHNHYDHCDLTSLGAISRRFHPTVVTLLGNARLLQSAGVVKIEELDWWRSSVTAPVPVTATPAQHFSARTPFDRNRALWGGFVVELGGRRLFFAGDSAYAPHFSEIGRQLGPIDTALMPIGAYEPRWFMRHVHVNPEEAVRAHQDLGAARSFGMHFGTFQLTAEAIDAPLVALAEARSQAGLTESEFCTLDFGESVLL